MRPIRPSVSALCLAAAVSSAAGPASAQQLYDFGTAFGRAAAVGGGDVLVGEPQNVVRPGRVYVFRPTTTGWLDTQVLAGEYLGETGATDHNLYVRGDLMYQSNYAAGLRVIDISDPVSPREVGFFDTAPFADDVPGFFDGSWSNYPFFESGNILVTSHKQGLFVLKRRVPVS